MIEALTNVPRIALGLLAALAIAAGFPELGVAEIADTSVTGGAQAPRESSEGGGAAALRQGDVAASVPDEAQAPGNGADSGPRPEQPDPQPVPPGATPRPPAEEPDSAQMDEDGESASDRTAPAPVNLNVNIRIFSPGDDGDVIQVTTPPSGSPGGSGGAGAGIDWDWNWTWTCGSGGRPGAKGAASGPEWNWSWNWDCDEQPGSLVGDTVQEAPQPTTAPDVGAPRPPTLPPQPLQSPLAEEGSDAGDDRGRGGGARAETVAKRSSRLVLATGAPAAYLLRSAATTAERLSSPGKGDAPRRAGSTGGPTDPFPALAIVGTAASTAPPPGGSSSILLVVLLGALCLLAPRTMEPVWARARTLSSRIGSERLERPG